ncbi:hypothetical protein SBF1_1450012 [Candidatus Desulfosporosinus infrequens]|uniref:Uncharacterized protein n=1 Tax=Candidatus Desulfosporosinus infrequens TaxID=2043169 RepID=A0A2U3K5S3_9FIRM|nr:hypothetical protein SBF1_1450012 [Candidatus Desulfosporosinus infrequens]
MHFCSCITDLFKRTAHFRTGNHMMEVEREITLVILEVKQGPLYLIGHLIGRN